MEKDIFRDRALFIDMEMNFMVVCAAQTARSMDEAKAMYESLVQDEIAMRYNRFALCCFSADRSHTSFDFCIYYNPEKQELYVFFDDITNGEMCMDGKRLPPLSATIKLKDYDNAMNKIGKMNLEKTTKENIKIYYTNAVILKIYELKEEDQKQFIQEIKKRKMYKNIKARNLKQLIKRYLLKFNIKLYIKMR